ncbi:MAG: hypothetical protein R3E68_03765 [Burkholderiaceae bacterium]
MISQSLTISRTAVPLPTLASRQRQEASGGERSPHKSCRLNAARIAAAVTLSCTAFGAAAADSVITPGNIEGVGLYDGNAIVVHRTLTTFKNENTGGWHYHPGYVYNVVVSGTIAVQDGCDAEPRLYSAGQAFETSDGRVHRAFVPKEPGKDTGNADAVEQNMFILPPELRNAEGKPILGRGVPDSMGHCGPPAKAGECGNDGWRKFDFPKKFASADDCSKYVANRPRMTVIMPTDPLK